jgi:hypothetical protein
MKDIRSLIALDNYFEVHGKVPQHDEDGEKACSNEIVGSFKLLLSAAQENVALSQLVSLPERLSPFTSRKGFRQMIGSRDNVFRIRDQLLEPLSTIEGLDSA